jgi:hypothetical protein
MNKFEQLGLRWLLKAILDLGFENPTEAERNYWKKKTQIWLRWLRQGQGKRQHLDFSYSEN